MLLDASYIVFVVYRCIIVYFYRFFIGVCSFFDIFCLKIFRNWVFVFVYIDDVGFLTSINDTHVLFVRYTSMCMHLNALFWLFIPCQAGSLCVTVLIFCIYMQHPLPRDAAKHTYLSYIYASLASSYKRHAN